MNVLLSQCFTVLTYQDEDGDCSKSYATDSWTTQVWVVWVHLYPYFFFLTNIVPVFSFYRSLNVLGKVWVLLENTSCRTTRTRIWVLILSKLFQLPAPEWVIYQFLCFQGGESSMQIFHSWGGVAAFNPRWFKGQLYLLLPLLEDGCLWISRAGRCGQVQGKVDVGFGFIQGGSELQLVFWFHLEVRPECG